ncbi:ATP binding cassette transporter [Myxozyma melibiosi]|uniref:ATP binding cassette transporter n=1 Tax=Myxozyma melibiosi TaxID=54550 RepID=A0ABR1F9C4_9ASCO
MPPEKLSSNTSLASSSTASAVRADAKDDSNSNGFEEDPEIEAEVLQLARTVSNLSSRSAASSDIASGNINPFIDQSTDPRLDPNSEHFSAAFFVRTLLDIEKRDPQTYPVRTAGVSFKNLSAFGYGTSTDYQKTVVNTLFHLCDRAFAILTRRKEARIDILRNFDGLLLPGEMLMVLGRPGSGCTTFLKAIAVDSHGFHYGPESFMNYQGVSRELMENQFRGEIVYNAETEAHFPHLTVGQTLYFAALARTPKNRITGVSRDTYASTMRDVVMSMLGLTHTLNTKVGDDYVRGVSGGERKRVSIAEAMLSGAPLQCWDNSTRGLDAATAISFIRNLKMFAKTTKTTSFVSLYQASQDAYDIFDKVTVLYEGRMIYFGSTKRAQKFFEDMGFECRARQTTGDFLTSLTNPVERIVKPGFEGKVPKTSDEFAERWRQSEMYAELMNDIDNYNNQYPQLGPSFEQFLKSHKAAQSDHISSKSPYTISYPMQVKICVVRGFQRIANDISTPVVNVVSNFALALIISSVFYNLPQTTSSFYSRGALLFFAVLISAFSCAIEIMQLYSQREIVEKHRRYALYHPSSEAIANMICELPAKICTCISFNVTLYFMTNLRREAGAFFIFLLFSFTCTLTMSGIFRTIAAFTKSISQAMAPSGVIMLLIVIYTGFTIPTQNMHGWFRWFNYIDPIAYVFESFLINEFRNRSYACSSFIPEGGVYDEIPTSDRICSSTGAVLGEDYVQGNNFIETSYRYMPSHIWRNYGILWAFLIFFNGLYLFATEYIRSARSKGEVLVFQRSHFAKHGNAAKLPSDDIESANQHENTAVGDDKSTDSQDINLQKQTDIFFWKNVCYDIPIKGGKTRRLLTNVDGYVKPGTLTALMGASGAGKTTLLDVLASRVTLGVVTGDMLVNGHQRDNSFQRKTGYVQQQDLHLSTSTVREALRFSAVLRQPTTVPMKERVAYVDEVIKILEMESYADAVVGVPGEGLNVEQRKRLSIGVELAAKPQLLLFLDEPTSGLDSQTAWSILLLLRKLTNHGQAILCTIHQPSAVLFQQFDRLLFLVPGGKPVYFGEIGPNSRTLIDYFERNGSPHCAENANPAEWMLEVVGAAPGSVMVKDFAQVWLDSPERAAIQQELDQMRDELSKLAVNEDPHGSQDFAAPFSVQFKEVIYRVSQQFYRTPTYIWSKMFLCFFAGFLIGFSFYKADKSKQGLQNQMFAVFMLYAIFGNISHQLMPNFVTQRSLYEVRERPSRTYSWQSFMAANIVAEIPWQLLCGLLAFVVWYYPIGLYENAKPTHKVGERGVLMFLLIEEFMTFTSTFSHMMIAGIEVTQTAAFITSFCLSMTLTFCGVLVSPDSMPGFWIFMYRISPFTYLVDAMLSVGVANTEVTCSAIEYSQFPTEGNLTCGEYMSGYMSVAGGYLEDPESTDMCSFCSLKYTNVFLASVHSSYDLRWRNFGLMWAYIIFNVFGAFFAYWLFRVPKKTTKHIHKISFHPSEHNLLGHHHQKADKENSAEKSPAEDKSLEKGNLVE